MFDETSLYPIIATSLFISLPIGLAAAGFLPINTRSRERIRAVAFGLFGLGVAFFGWAASWPGPNGLTLTMMISGLVLAGQALCTLARSCTSRV